MISEEAEPVNTVKAWVVENEKITPLEVKENQILETLDGVASLSRKGTAFLVATFRNRLSRSKLKDRAKFKKSSAKNLPRRS